MFHSAEIRWFMEGDVPREVREWFQADGAAIDEQPRVDEYLVLPGAVSTGVKFRQYSDDDRASFEIKTRTSPAVAVKFGDDLVGRMDTWVKWSCRPTEVASFRESITAGDDAWIHIEKRRCLRKFSLDGAAPVEVNPRTDRPTEGCQFELTSIRAGIRKQNAVDWGSAQRAWSASFESFGEPRSLRDYVQQVAALTLIDWPATGLDESSSCGYSEWILGFDV